MSRMIPTHARKPCSGCVRSRKMISTSAAVLGPTSPACRVIRSSPTSRFYETNPFNFNGIGLLLVTIGRAPCALRFDHGIGDPEDAVEVGDVRIREGGFSDSQGRAVARGQDDGADLMRLESVARRCP